MKRPKLWRNSNRVFDDEQIALLVCVHSILDSHITDVVDDHVVISFNVVKLFDVILVADESLSHVVNISVCESIDEVQDWITQLPWLHSEMRIDQKLSVGVGFIYGFEDVRSSLMNFIPESLASRSLLDEGQEETNDNKNTCKDFDNELKSGR